MPGVRRCRAAAAAYGGVGLRQCSGHGVWGAWWLGLGFFLLVAGAVHPHYHGKLGCDVAWHAGGGHASRSYSG
jgi:hypothetical protein